MSLMLGMTIKRIMLGVVMQDFIVLNVPIKSFMLIFLLYYYYVQCHQ
jgi:hypothetical protein